MDEMDEVRAFAGARLEEDEERARRVQAVLDNGWNYFDETPTELIDPARVLREVETGRRILARHWYCIPWWDGPCEHAGTTGEPPCPDMRDLLYRWADHPDYREEWKPVTAGTSASQS